MPFARECQMTGPVRQWLVRQGLLIKTEFQVPWGICDLVAVSFNLNQVAKRLSFRQYRSIGPVQRIELLSIVPDQESGAIITLNRLRELATGTALESCLETELGKLIADGFVVENNDGSFQKLNGWTPMHDRIIAVELKLFRISEALSQAVSNRTFATESFVALPMHVAQRLLQSTRRSEFGKAGIGVIGVASTFCKVVLPASQAIEADVILQTHCVERFWRTRDN